MTNTLSINDNIQRADLERKLKEANLSKEQIEEIVPVILESLEKIRDLKKEKTKITTQNDLKNLGESITNKSNIENTSKATVNIGRDNNWNIIWNITNTTNITTGITNNNTNIRINLNYTKLTTPKTAITNPEPQKTIATNPEPLKTTTATPKTTYLNPEQLVQNNTFIDNNTHIENMADIHTPYWFLSMIDKLLQEIEETKQWISKKWLSKAWKKAMDNAKKKLEQYKKNLEGKKKGLEKQNLIRIYDSDIEHLKFLRQQLENTRKEIWLWQWWEYSSISSFLYNSPEIAKDSNKRKKNNLEFTQKLEEETKKWAIYNIFNWNVQKATEFYRRIAQWDYTQADYELFRTNAAILTPSFQNCKIAIPIWPKYTQGNTSRIEYTSWTSRKSIDYSNMDLWEAFQQWWLAWLIDKGLSNCKNMTPWQRNTRKNLAVLWGFAAWIFWLYKFFTNEKMSLRWKALTTGWVILASQAITWEGPISLYTKLITWWFTKEYLESKFWWSAFWDAISWVWNSGIESANIITPAMYSMIIFNPETTVWEIRSLTTKFKTDNNERANFRQDAINKIKSSGYWETCIEHFSATFSNDFDDEKWNNRLASIWITDSTDSQKTIHELANNASWNEVALNKFKSENWLKETNDKAKKEELHEYINSLKKTNQAIDVTVLEKHKNDWFILDKNATYSERSKDYEFKENLSNQIDSLGINESKKSELKTAAEIFYDRRTIDSKPRLWDFSLSIENWLVVLTSNSWQKSRMNITTWELEWFWNWIRFSDLSELLDVADLSNKILDTQKWKSLKNTPPFQYKTSRKWICFNDADLLSFNMDTRVISTGWRWATSKIDTLCRHPNEYAQYLSRRRTERNKVNIDSTSYPLTKMLSDSWIQFFNEQEVKELESRLKTVKETLKFSVCTPDWNPFSIEILSNKLKFKAVNKETKAFPGDIMKKFPTLKLSWNEEKFLKAMNEPTNKMWWSALH